MNDQPAHQPRSFDDRCAVCGLDLTDDETPAVCAEEPCSDGQGDAWSGGFARNH